MKKITFLLITSLLLIVSYSANAKSAKQDVTDTVNHFLATVNAKATHQAFWAEDLIYTSSSGERFGKSKIVDGMKDGSKQEGPSPYSADELTVHFHGDTAVVTFKLVFDEGKSRKNYFNTGVLVKRENRWQAVTWQATVIPEKG